MVNVDSLHGKRTFWTVVKNFRTIFIISREIKKRNKSGENSCYVIRWMMNSQIEEFYRRRGFHIDNLSNFYVIRW